MYANYYGPASPQPGLSNNPFIEDPTTAHARFPDLTASTFQPGYPSNDFQHQPQQYQPHHPSQSYGSGGPYQVQPQMMSPQFAATQQMGPHPASIGAFQPTNGFAQPSPQQYPVSSGYPYSSGSYPPQRTNATPSYLSEFDPYARQAPSQSQSQIGQQTSGVGPGGIAHPRDLIRIHKFGLEAWDANSWKQLLNACDALREAWSMRQQQAETIVRQYGGHSDQGLFGPDPAFGYNGQVEGWRQVLQDANNNFDTVAASTFQLHEVFNSYRQSSDQASKRRVRESCNAAVKSLPDWPSN